MNKWERLVAPGRATMWMARHERGLILASAAFGVACAVLFAHYLLTEGLGSPLLTYGGLAVTSILWIAMFRQCSRYVRAWEKQEADDAQKRSDD